MASSERPWTHPCLPNRRLERISFHAELPQLYVLRFYCRVAQTTIHIRTGDHNVADSTAEVAPLTPSSTDEIRGPVADRSVSVNRGRGPAIDRWRAVGPAGHCRFEDRRMVRGASPLKVVLRYSSGTTDDWFSIRMPTSRHIS